MLLATLTGLLTLPAPALVPTQGLPDLSVTHTLPVQRTVATGESLVVAAWVVNRGDRDALDVPVRISSRSGWSQTVALESVPAGKGARALFSMPTTEAERLASPHFLTLEVDPQNRIAESSEDDNALSMRLPVFVADLAYRAPELEEEHDDVLEIADGRLSTFTTRRFGADGAPSEREELVDPQKRALLGQAALEAVPGLEQPRVDPRLVARAAEAQPGTPMQFVVVYEHDVPMLPLRPLDAREGRFSPQNLVILQEREATLEAVRRMRRESAANVAFRIEAGGGRVQEYFTLAGAMLVEVPGDQLERIAGLPNVRHLEVVEGGELPPNSVRDGRNRVGSDPYFNGGATGSGYIALLDTGVRTSHTLFTSPDHILFWEDCVFGNSSCNDSGSSSYNPDDNNWNHGTSTAAILTGNSDLGSNTRGVTASWLDSWKIYSSAGLNTRATLRAFDEAVRWGDQVIVGEIQSTQGSSGSIARAADSAFDAGHITIAAAGNYGPGSGSVASPGNAHKAIAVGAYDVDSGAAQSYSGRGPTSDGRVKPDIKAPTNTRTASSASSTALRTFTGTSGATPYAAGAASVFADWFNLTSRTQANAGKVYASLINGGPLSYVSSVHGTGNFSLPLGGTLYTGSRNVSHHENEIVSFYVAAGKRVTATIWWPEDQSDSHADVDLYIRDRFDATRDSSLRIGSVFEHGITATATSSNAGTWDLRIYGYSVPGSAQTVYYSIHVK